MNPELFIACSPNFSAFRQGDLLHSSTPWDTVDKVSWKRPCYDLEFLHVSQWAVTSQHFVAWCLDSKPFPLRPTLNLHYTRDAVDIVFWKSLCFILQVVQVSLWAVIHQQLMSCCLASGASPEGPVWKLLPLIDAVNADMKTRPYYYLEFLQISLWPETSQNFMTCCLDSKFFPSRFLLHHRVFNKCRW